MILYLYVSLSTLDLVFNVIYMYINLLKLLSSTLSKLLTSTLKDDDKSYITAKISQTLDV